MADKEITIKVNTEADSSQVDDLKNKVDDLSISADDASAAMDGASESADNLGSSTDSVSGDSLSQASGDADELGDSLSGADQEAQNLGNDLSLLEASALLDISNQVGSIGANAEGMAQDMNTAAISVGHLATQTGIAEPQMISLVNTISNATFPQAEAMQYVTVLDQLGVSSQNLGNAATDMDRINDAFGIGSDKVVSLTGNLYAMGVPADNLQSSYGALAYAQSNVAGGVDQFSTTLQRLAPMFGEYGLNVDQAAVITAAASQKWGTGRRAMSNLSDALKDANGDTKALEEALGLESGALDNANQVTGQYSGQVQELANEEKEHKTILDEMNAAWEDMSLQLSPVLEPLGSFMGLIGQAGSYAVGINGLVTLAQSMNTLRNAEILSTIATKASAAAQWLLNIAMDANPIMLVVLAIIALVAILGYLYFNNEQVRAAIDGLGQTFMWVGQIMYTSIINAVNWIIGALQNLWTYIITLGGLLPENVSITGNSIIDTVLRVMAFIATLPAQLGIIFINMIAKTLGFGNNFVQNMIRAGSQSVSNFIGYITQLPGKLAAELNNMLSTVGQWAATLPQKFWDAGVNAVKNFLSALGIASPGIMQRTLEWEVTEMGENIPEQSRTLLTNIGRLGEDVVDEFGNPALGLTYEDTANASIVNNNNNTNEGNGQSIRDLILNIGSVDDEERINQIIEALRRYLAFDHETAGRTT